MTDGVHRRSLGKGAVADGELDGTTAMRSAGAAPGESARPGLVAWMFASVRTSLPWAAVAVTLSLVTYTTTGYEYQVWPQYFLQSVLRYSGHLQTDWAMSFPIPHWAFAHALAWVPARDLARVVHLTWMLGIVGLWLAFASVCRAVKVSWAGTFAAGLIGAATGLAGLGLSRPVTGYLYPTNIAFVLVVAGLAALLWDRPILLGLALGFATLIHPQVGVLGAIALLPAFFLTSRRRSRIDVIGLAVALVAPAAPAVYEILTNQAFGSHLSSHERYELLAVVRAPWHFLYRAFPTGEYAETLAWLVVFLVGLRLLPRTRQWRAVAVVMATCIVVCTMGGVASQVGWPLFLVQIQTARLTSLTVLLGIVVGFAALQRVVGSWAGAVGMLVFLLTPVVRDGLLGMSHLPGQVAAAIDTSSVAACALGALIVSFALVADGAPALAKGGRVVGLVLACLLVVVGISLVVPFEQARAQAQPQAQQDWMAVAMEAKLVSRTDDVFLVPPDQDLFSLWSDRPVVVTFGSFEFGAGDTQWMRRMTVVTGGDQRVLSPSLKGGGNARLQLMAADYAHTVATSRIPICAYHARFVVVGSSVAPPPWLTPVYRTVTYRLFRVKRGVCGGGAG